MGIDAPPAQSNGSPGRPRTRTRRAAAVVSALGFAALSGCGSGSSAEVSHVRVAAPARLTPAQKPVPLQETTWQLVQVQTGDRSWWTRPNLDSTLVVDPDGDFFLRACNNVFGTVTPGPRIATFDGGTVTSRRCPGTAGRVDGVLAEALHGSVAWEIRDRTLELDHPKSGLRLVFRVADVAQPPVSAVPVATVDEAGLSCRVLVGAAAAGERIYVLARTRPGGPWRLIPGGPAAPREGPVLASQLLDESSGRRCTTGFAPADATEIAFEGTGWPRDLELYRVPGIGSPVYAGIVPADGGTLRARDGAGRTLASWPTTP